ncbi:hypothetical protein F4781DRAFT_229848 [Annulohypoxylon bovei var. microspora]|nr:hypothetical protein F4781DRAFT_229848 [Annulohypoxylon bovei var. microspora]
MATRWDVEKAVYPEDMLPATPSRSSLSEDGDAETVAGGMQDVDNDAISVSSRVSYPDPLGRKDLLTFDYEPAKTVYEAWELTDGEDTIARTTWKTIFGIKIGAKWKSLNNGFMELDPLAAYSQGELADLHADAIREYEAKGPKNGKPYAQDLANRVADLKAEIYNKIQFLVDDKVKATNKTPFRRREWRIIVLEEGEFQMTELLPERKRRLFWKSRETPAVRRFFIVLRGEEVKTTKESEGWQQFNRHGNPWCRVDMRETQEARREHREHFEHIHRKFGVRRGPIIRNEMSCERRI